MRALRPCDLDVSPSSIHALVGQNGAGKSTLLGIMAGRIRPASGSVEVFGADQSLGDPRAARAAGVVGIYQELTTVPATTALENVFLGQWPSRRGLLSKKKMLGAFQQLCRRLGVLGGHRSLLGRSLCGECILDVLHGVAEHRA